MRKTIVALASAAAAVTLVGGTGLASASARPASPAASGTEHFYLMTTSGTAIKAPFIASGLFTAAGTDFQGNTTDTVKLPGGTFKIHHPGKNGRPKVNPLTCLFTLKMPADFTVYGGTGKYTGISGSGKAVVSILAILSRSHGQCSEDTRPAAWQETITGKGSLHL